MLSRWCPLAVPLQNYMNCFAADLFVVARLASPDATFSSYYRDVRVYGDCTHVLMTIADAVVIPGLGRFCR